jgi:hypothetical protein
MAVRELTAPATSRTRKAKYPYTEAEVKEAVKMLKAGKTPGVGPYEGENAIREARSAAQALVRLVTATDGSLDVGTRAWEDDEGDAYAILRIRG